jgi:hypothetical protein
MDVRMWKLHIIGFAELYTTRRLLAEALGRLMLRL